MAAPREDDGWPPAETADPLPFRALVEMLRSPDVAGQDRAVRLLHRDFYGPLRVIVRRMMRTNPEIARLEESGAFWDSVVMTLRDKRIDLDHQDPSRLLATIMKRKLLLAADKVNALKRGGGATRVQFLESEAIASADPTASQEAIAREAEAIIERRKQELPEKQRIILRLVEEGHHPDSIAARLGKSPAAVRMARKRAIDQLKGAVEPGERPPE